jgi:hypothetical protein
MTATTLWGAVVDAYDEEGLITLTNPRTNAATSINDEKGTSAAQEVLDLFPIYAQQEADLTDGATLAVCRRGVIAVLYERGGTASTIAAVEYGEVFGDEGLVSKLKRTSARARSNPQSNSGVKTKSELSSTGRGVRGWSDPESLPGGRSYMPRRTLVDD